MNVGITHVCVEVFYDSVRDATTDLEALRKLSMVSKEWQKAVQEPYQQKKIETISQVLDCVGQDGMCHLRSLNKTFNIKDTMIRMDALCCLCKRLLQWRSKKSWHRIPDYSVMFSEAMFDLQEHPDIDIESRIMKTMTLLITGTHFRCFDGYPALKLCWLYLLCNFMLQALNKKLYLDLFTNKKFAAVVVDNIASYRNYLRKHMKKVPATLRPRLMCLFDELEIRLRLFQ
jgi:hypothetical protein